MYNLNNEYDFSSVKEEDYSDWDEGSKFEAMFRDRGAIVHEVALSYIEDAVATGDAGPTLSELIFAVVDYTYKQKGWLPAGALVSIGNELKEIGLAHVDK